MVVYLLEDHTLPLINGVAYVKSRKLLRPGGRGGLGGPHRRPHADGRRGGAERGRAGRNASKASPPPSRCPPPTSTPPRAFRRCVKILTRCWACSKTWLPRPTLNKAASRSRGAAPWRPSAARTTIPVGIAVREFNRRLAEGHPAGYVPTEETVNNISREDMVAFYERYFKPNATVLALSGDFRLRNDVGNARDHVQRLATPPRWTTPRCRPTTPHPSPKFTLLIGLWDRASF